MCREGVVRALCAAGMVILAAFAAGCSKKPPQELGTGAEGPITPGSPREFAASVGDKVYFEVDSASLTPQAMSTLQGQARWLARYPNYAVTIEGHADERGTREYNIALGAKRATSVKNYLASLGVPPQRLRTISYGKERPVALCADISCWSQNRRAVTALGRQAGS